MPSPHPLPPPDAPVDCERILRYTFVRGIEAYSELESTNSHALTHGSRFGELPHLVIARRQTAGRGRGENRWWSDDGALTFSLVIDTHAPPIAAERLPLLSLIAALALADTVELILEDLNRRQSPPAPIPPVQLKWPNDVYLQDRKLAGILIEAVPATPSRFVIGVGVNVNTSFDEAPHDVRQRAVSLRDLTAAPLPLTDLLVEFLRRFQNWNLSLTHRPRPVIESYRRRCWLTGKSVVVHGPQETVRGECRGISDTGALLLLTREGERTCLAGTVEVAG